MNKDQHGSARHAKFEANFALASGFFKLFSASFEAAKAILSVILRHFVRFEATSEIDAVAAGCSDFWVEAPGFIRGILRGEDCALAPGCLRMAGAKARAHIEVFFSRGLKSAAADPPNEFGGFHVRITKINVLQKVSCPAPRKPRGVAHPLFGLIDREQQQRQIPFREGWGTRLEIATLRRTSIEFAV